MKKIMFLYILLLFVLFRSTVLYGNASSRCILYILDDFSVKDLSLLPTGAAAFVQGKNQELSYLLNDLNFLDLQTQIHGSLTDFPLAASDVSIYTASSAKELVPWITHWSKQYKIIVTSLSEKSLNTLWMYSEKNTLLLSSSTRRKGLIRNTDIPFLLYSLIKIPTEDMPIMEFYLLSTHPSEVLKTQEKQFVNLYMTRYILLGWMIFLFILFLFLKKHTLKRLIGYNVILSPLVSLTFSTLSLTGLGVFFTTVLILTCSLMISGILIQWKDYLFLHYSAICGITACIILISTYIDISLIYESPIGYNNILIGGRFYGLNNDILGILVGSIFSTLFLLGYRLHFSSHIFSIAGVLISIGLFIAFSPKYGSNAGGMLTSILCAILFVRIYMNHHSWRWLLLLLSITIFIVIGQYFMTWDLHQIHTSHLGRFVSLLQNKNYFDVIHIFINKLKQFLFYLLLPPFNMIVLLELYILFNLKSNSSFWVKADVFFCLTSLGSIFFNDTGILSALLILAYYIVFKLLYKLSHANISY